MDREQNPPQRPSNADERPIAPPEAAAGLSDNFTTTGGEPLSVGEAITTNLKLNKHIMNQSDMRSRYEHARYRQYPRILEADRKFQSDYQLTTATVTRRVDPYDENDTLLTLWELDERLHAGGIHRAMNNALRYHLDPFEYEYAAVTTPDEYLGVPKELLHLWVDDPGDGLSVGHLEPALEKHLEYSPGDTESRHKYRTDGTGGAIQIAPSPETVDELPEELASLITHSEAGARYPTISAHDVATELPDLVVGDYYNPDKPNPSNGLLEGAAAARFTPHEWLRTSRGLPSL